MASQLAAELRDPNAPAAPLVSAKPRKRTDGKKGMAASTSSSTGAVHPATSQTIGGVLMKKIEKLTAMIDDSLDGDSIMPSLCANVQHAQAEGPLDTLNTTAETANMSDEHHPDSPAAVSPVDGDHNVNFASWLASQEFDASAIVWNGDDANPKDLSTSTELDVLPDMGRNCEYSRDEFLEAGGPATGTSLIDTKSETSDDGYVSIADVKGDKFWRQLPPAVSDVWNKVRSANWQCWQEPGGNLAESKLALAAKFNGMGSHGVPGSEPPKGIKPPSEMKRLPSILKKSSFDIKSVVSESTAGQSSRPDIWRRSVGKSSSANHRRKNSLDNFAVMTPREGTKEKPSRGHGRKPSLDQLFVVQPSEDTAEKPIVENSKKSGVRTAPQSELKPKNLDDILLEAAAQRMNETKPADASSVATSIVTPLVGEDIATVDGSDKGGAITFATPGRLDRTTGSCTYSVSPGRPPIAAVAAVAADAALTTATGSSEADEENKAAAALTAAISTDAGDNPFRLAAQLASGESGSKSDNDDIDTPLISSDSKDEAKGKKSRGRRRRRMRLAK